MVKIGTSIELGRVVQEARAAAGLTQEQLAARARVSRRWLIELERGHENAQIGKVLHLLGVLDLELEAVERRKPASDELDELVESEFL